MSDQIDEIKSKTDIVSLLSEYIELKKAGRNYKALCPFHSEKTPSFMVSPELQIFKCFGCGESGDAIAFLEKYEGMDFYEALKFLATRAGIELKPFKSETGSDKEKLYNINNLTAYFYHWVLLHHPKASNALNYLKVRRKLTLKTIDTFQIGYSPDIQFASRKFLVEKKKISLKDLERAGLLYLKNGQAYDRFRGRVIFPLNDHRGNTVGFAGRILPDNDKGDLAKYINTPETDIYHKSRVLYGLNLTKKDIKKEKTAVVMEGELDAISSWQVGLKNVVAIKGTALTEDQTRLLRRFADTLILALDTDVAGDSAAKRGIDIAQKQGFEIKVAKLIGYKDPDEAAHKDPDALFKAIKKAVNIWDFLIESVLERYQGKSGSDKAKISREVVPILSSIQDKIVQAHYIALAARRLDVPVDAVIDEVKQHKVTESVKPQIEILIKKEIKTRRELLEERLLAVAFRYDSQILLDEDIDEFFSSQLIKKIIARFRLHLKKHKKADFNSFVKELPSELTDGFIDSMVKDLKGVESEAPDRLKNELALLKREIRILGIKARLENIAKKIRELEKLKNKKELETAKEEFGKLSKNLNELETENFKGIIL